MPYDTDERCSPARDSRNVVVLSVASGEEDRARETLGDIVQSTGAPADFFVFTSGPLGAKLNQELAGAGFVAIPGQYDHEQSFVAAVHRFHEGGFFFVRAGVRLPEAWDLRLLWTALRHDGVGIATPLQIRKVPRGIESYAAFDQLCCLHSSLEPRACPPLFSCAYVSPAAACAVLRQWKDSPSRAGFAAFEEILGRLRFRSLVVDHVAVGGVTLPPSAATRKHEKIANAVHRKMGAGAASGFSMRSLLAPRSLHVLHSWGGGSDRWVKDYCAADQKGKSFVLLSINTHETLGCQLWLYRDPRDHQPIRQYRLDPQINGTAVEHESYANLLANILEEFGIESIIVSSLIGHSLDVLRTGRPTVIVCHDYYPFCPALNITFESVCHSCNEGELTACTLHNPHNRFFGHVPVFYWLQLRKTFARTVLERHIPMLAPSKSVVAHYSQLLPELARAFRVVPHGTRRLRIAVGRSARAEGFDRLKVIVLGALTLNKGREIVRDIADDLGKFADLYLVGAGIDGRRLAQDNGIRVIERYVWHNLPELIAEIGPDLALLPSVVPETFSYTLQELFDLGIPVLATCLGSFNDRIADGVTGFLCEPEGTAILARIRHLHANRPELARVREALGTMVHRSLEEMIDDYGETLRSPRFSSRAYFAKDFRRHMAASRTRCRLLWRAPGESFTEARSSSAHYAVPVARQKLTLELPRMPAPAVLRFVPAERPGIVILHDLRMLDRKGRAIWCWNQVVSHYVTSLGSNLVIFEDTAADTVMCALDSNPHLLLPVPKDALENLGSGGLLELEISSLGPEDSTALLRNECAKEFHRHELDGMLNQMAAATGSTGEPAANPWTDLEHTQRRVIELEASWSWRITKPLRVLADRVPGLLHLLNRGGPGEG